MRRTLPLAVAFSFCTSLFAQPAFTDGSALLSHSATSSGCMAVTDMDGDGLDDIVQLDDADHVYVLYRNVDGSFTTYDYGSLNDGNQWGWAIADLNNDGHKDICSGSGGNTNFVNITARGVYTLTELDGPAIFTQCMSMGDMDNDGRVDVLACHDNGHPNIWFTNASGVPVNNNGYIDWNTNPISDMSGNYGSCFVDFDNDGDQDFYISHCRQGVSNSSDPRRWNRLFVNDGTDHFTDQAALYGVDDHEQTWTTDFGDYDNDGDLDMFSTEHSTGNKIFQNDGTGHFTEVPSTVTGLGITNFPLQGMFRDLDNDGFLDILVAGGESHYYKGHGDGGITEVTGVFGTTALHGYAFGDLNGDGFEDVYANYGDGYVTPSGTPDKLWLNTPNGNHFLRVRLQGTTSNRDAVGARVTITGPWGTQIREIRSGESYGLVNSFIASFGLGAETTVPTMTVRWPSGLLETFNDLNADQTLTVVEGECISPNVAIAASPSPILCSGGAPVQLTASPGTYFVWSTGETGPSISVDGAGTYSTTLAGNGNCITEALVNVVYSPDETPSISVQGGTTICPQDQVVLTASPAASYLWSNGSDQQTIAVSAAGDYTVTIAGSCGDFTSAPVAVSLLDAPTAPPSNNVFIPAPGTAQLAASGDSILWYAVANGGVAIGNGSPWTTPVLNANTNYWCADLGDNTVAPAYGGKMNKSTTGAYQDNDTYFLYFSTNAEDMIINSAKVYANGAGNRTIAIVQHSGGAVVASGTYYIPDGESRVQLDLVAPAGGNYGLRIMGGDPQLWRDAIGSNPAYPYDLGGLGSITDASSGTAYYYFFYDWEVSVPVVYCESPRTPVTVFVGPVGIAGNGTPNVLGIFPNPATGMVTITGPANSTGSRVDLIDLAGRVCLSGTLAAMEEGIDVSALASGTYTVRLSNGSNRAYGVLVKQ
ncbi:MAG: VCBS repeat-containing protein [Flavobacteriales bacterium]|nr:VCBS repeat-containing protein [Flavobacteriales bacterium]